MTRYTRGLSIVVTLALTMVGQIAGANSQSYLTNPTPAEKALEEPAALSGKVVETMDAGGYTYVCLEKNGTKTWVAAPRMKVTVGQELAFAPGGEMVDFTSKSLNRTFPTIIFSPGLLKPQQAAQETVPTAQSGKTPDVSKDKVAGVDNAKVDKATGPNGYTVAEVYEKKVALDRQKVTVRGKVVKVSSGIMGKNWVHLRDGSGDAAQKTNNLVVTTQDMAAVGDVVTANGTLYKDKDFGAGYKYDLIMEEATLKP